jgi:hypothetical protein
LLNWRGLESALHSINRWGELAVPKAEPLPLELDTAGTISDEGLDALARLLVELAFAEQEQVGRTAISQSSISARPASFPSQLTSDPP